VTKNISPACVKLIVSKAGAKHELLYNKPATGLYMVIGVDEEIMKIRASFNYTWAVSMMCMY
jgi:hypothetical protein